MSIAQNHQNKQCKIEGCRNKALIRSMCSKHRRLYASYRLNVSDEERKIARPAIIEGDIAKIPLGVNAKDGYAIVDREFAYLDKYKWTISNYGYATGSYGLMHHLISGKPKDKLVTDHINRNKLDNRSKNLRIVPQSTNMLNWHKVPLGSSGHRNIYIVDRPKPFALRVSRAGKVVLHRHYLTLSEAVAARDKFLDTL